jgi:hypothetical protein
MDGPLERSGNVKRVRKREARRRYDAGETVYIISHKMMPFTAWHIEYAASKREDVPFDRIVQEYSWYNCSYETGYYPAYYVEGAST